MFISVCCREFRPAALKSRQTTAFHRPMLMSWTFDGCFRSRSFRLANMCALVMISAYVCVLSLSDPARAWLEQNLQNQTSEAMSRMALPKVFVGTPPKVFVGTPPKVFVGIMSAPGNSDRRDQWRNKWKCGKQLQAEGIPYRFIVGWPMDENRSLAIHRRGQVPTDSEASQAKQLRNESSMYQDFKFLHFPDTYLGLQSKTFALFKYGYGLGASYIVKMDDDICVNARRLMIQIEEHETQAKKGGPPALYAGWYLITLIPGIDGLNTPYFSGVCYLLSQDLVRGIVEEESMDAVLFAPYGSYDEDAQTGRWVSFVQKHRNITVNFMTWKPKQMHKHSAHPIP